MTATHPTGRHRRSRRRDDIGRRLTSVSMMAAAGAAGWLITAHAAQPQPALAPQLPAAAPSHEEIQRTGQVIAASRDTLTTSTPDGQTTTFRITPDTTQIGAPGLKKNVVVLGILHNGVAVATAIADEGAIGQGGPPMDYELPT